MPVRIVIGIVYGIGIVSPHCLLSNARVITISFVAITGLPKLSTNSAVTFPSVIGYVVPSHSDVPPEKVALVTSTHAKGSSVVVVVVVGSTVVVLVVVLLEVELVVVVEVLLLLVVVVVGSTVVVVVVVGATVVVVLVVGQLRLIVNQLAQVL